MYSYSVAKRGLGLWSYVCILFEQIQVSWIFCSTGSSVCNKLLCVHMNVLFWMA